MIQIYISLRKDVASKESQLREQILKSKEDIQVLEGKIQDCQTSLEKGNGFHQLLLSQYTEDLEGLKKGTVLNLSKMKGELEKSKKDLMKLVDKNKKLGIFENYNQVIPSEEFKKSLVNLIEGHRAGILPPGILEKAKKASMKFKELEFEGQKYQVKDNRTNYSDMIIFNQDNQILFGKRNKEDEFEPNKYALPGGHVEPAESPKLAAIREVEEEVFLTLNPTMVIPVGVYESGDTVISYFCIKIDAKDLNPILEEREFQQYTWVSIDEISELDLILNLKENFETVINIPTDLLTTPVKTKEIAALSGLPGSMGAGLGLPV